MARERYGNGYKGRAAAPDDARQLQRLCGPLSAFAKAGPRGSRSACRASGWFWRASGEFCAERLVR
jgi:hypothetical protein